MRIRTLLVPLVASLVLLTGCTGITEPAAVQTSLTPESNGVDQLTADEIIDQALEAVGNADSFRLQGPFGEAPLTVDAYVFFGGGNAQGTGTILTLQLDLVRVDRDIYLKGDATILITLFPQLAANLDKINGKWIRFSLEQIPAIVTVPFSTTDVVNAFSPRRPVTKGEPATLSDGTEVITVTDANGVVYSVATVGEPYLRQVEDAGQVRELYDFGAPITIEAPTPFTDYDDL